MRMKRQVSAWRGQSTSRDAAGMKAERKCSVFFFGRPLILWNFCFDVYFFFLDALVAWFFRRRRRLSRFTLLDCRFFYCVFFRVGLTRALASAEAARRKIGEWVAINARTRGGVIKSERAWMRCCHCHRRKHQKPFQLKEKTAARPLSIRVSRFSRDKSMWTFLSGSLRKVKQRKCRSIMRTCRGMK